MTAPKRARPGPMIDRAVRTLTSLPEVVEVDWRGHRTFMVGRRSFAGVDEHGVACRADKAERPALVARPWFTEPPFVGRYGWIGIRFDAVDDWGEVAELLETAYRVTAPKRLVQLLDIRAIPPYDAHKMEP